MNRLPGILFLAFVCLFWNGLIGVFDVIIVRGIALEHTARTSFVPVEATVVSSTIEEHSSSDGTSYEPKVVYRYRFDGTEYSAERVSYSLVRTSGSSYAEGVVEEYPAGALIQALVNPKSPDEAVLDVSGNSLPRGIFLFLTPFHCVGVFLIVSLVLAIRRRNESKEEGRRRRYVPIEDERHIVIAKPLLPAWSIFLIALGSSSLVVMFPVLLAFGFHASSLQVGAAIVLCLGIATYFAMRRRKVKQSPESYVHIDRRIGVFSYPADAEGHRIDDVVSIVNHPRATNTTINDELQYEHRLEVETRSGMVELFEFRGAESEGSRLKRILEAELLPEQTA